MNSLFCRHNRFTAECPICSKGTVFDTGAQAPRRQSSPRPAPSRRGGKRPAPPPGAARVTVGPYAATGPYDGGDGRRYEVRLERVPGGLRLGSWAGGALERRAPVLPRADLAALVRMAREREALAARDLAALERALSGGDGSAATAGSPAMPAVPGGAFGSSQGRTGEMRDELRVEAVDHDAVPEALRVARWIYRPGPREWELLEAPPMLPASRFAEAISGAVSHGLLHPT